MSQLKLRLAAVCCAALLAILLAAGPLHAQQTCYQRSTLSFFGQIVELTRGERDLQRGCWVLRLRFRGGANTPAGNAMLCGTNACNPNSAHTEGIYWLSTSAATENIAAVLPTQNGSCTDMSFCVVPINPKETLLIDFAALFEAGYYLPPTTLRPRWSDGVIDLSSLDGTKSHCQDGEPRGAVCL